MRLAVSIASLMLVLSMGAWAAESSDTTSHKDAKPVATQSVKNQSASNQALSKPLYVSPPKAPNKWAKIKELFL